MHAYAHNIVKQPPMRVYNVAYFNHHVYNIIQVKRTSLKTTFDIVSIYRPKLNNEIVRCTCCSHLYYRINVMLR